MFKLVSSDIKKVIHKISKSERSRVDPEGKERQRYMDISQMKEYQIFSY